MWQLDPYISKIHVPCGPSPLAHMPGDHTGSMTVVFIISGNSVPEAIHVPRAHVRQHPASPLQHKSHSEGAYFMLFPTPPG